MAHVDRISALSQPSSLILLLLCIDLVLSRNISTPTRTLGPSSYFETGIAPYWQYTNDTIICPSGDCYIECTGWVRCCYLTKVDASAADSLTIDCLEAQSCQGLELIGSPTDTLDVRCSSQCEAIHISTCCPSCTTCYGLLEHQCKDMSLTIAVHLLHTFPMFLPKPTNANEQDTTKVSITCEGDPDCANSSYACY